MFENVLKVIDELDEINAEMSFSFKEDRLKMLVCARKEVEDAINSLKTEIVSGITIYVNDRLKYVKGECLSPGVERELLNIKNLLGL